jgi:hypothetical protein
MKQKIDSYSGSLSSLNNLIVDLEGLLNCLENVDDNWKDSFYKFWEELEIIYAFAVYEEKNELSKEEQAAIIKNLAEILKLSFFEKTGDYSEN